MIKVVDTVEDLMDDRVAIDEVVNFDIANISVEGESMSDHEDEYVPLNAPVQWEFLGMDTSEIFHDDILAEVLGNQAVSEAAKTTQKILEVARDEKSPAEITDVVPIEETLPVGEEDHYLDNVVLLGAAQVRAALGLLDREAGAEGVQRGSRREEKQFDLIQTIVNPKSVRVVHHSPIDGHRENRLFTNVRKVHIEGGQPYMQSNSDVTGGAKNPTQVDLYLKDGRVQAYIDTVEQVTVHGGKGVVPQKRKVLGTDIVDIPADTLEIPTIAGSTFDVSSEPTVADAMTEDEAEEAFPLLAEFYRQFRDREQPTYIRYDTRESYLGFRKDASPEMVELQNKVRALDALLHAHLADGHGGQEVVGELVDDISVLQESVKRNRVPLQMPPWMDGTWDCWREDGPSGGTICCTMALPGPDGDVCYVTSATPVSRHVQDVVGYARKAGGSVSQLLGVLPTVACMMGGGHLFPRMAGAAPKVLARPEVQRGDSVWVGKIASRTSPSLAASMALLQRAQGGDPQAQVEWKKLGMLSKLEARLGRLLQKAKSALSSAQK